MRCQHTHASVFVRMYAVCMYVCMYERERGWGTETETETGTDRQTDRQIDRQTNRQTDYTPVAHNGCSSSCLARRLTSVWLAWRHRVSVKSGWPGVTGSAPGLVGPVSL